MSEDFFSVFRSSGAGTKKVEGEVSFDSGQVFSAYRRVIDDVQRRANRSPIKVPVITYTSGGTPVWSAKANAASGFDRGRQDALIAKTFPALVSGAQQAGRSAAKGLAPLSDALAALPGQSRKARLGLADLASGVFLVEKGARALSRALAAPLEMLVDSTEQARKFSTQMAAVVGSTQKATLLRAGLVRDSRNLPLSVDEMEDAARAVGFTPALSARLATGNARREVVRYAGVTSRLKLLDPYAGDPSIALKEMFEGDLVSIRRRYGLQPQTLARQIVKDFGGSMSRALDELKSSPDAGLRAVERFLDAYLPPESLSQSSNLISKRLQNIQSGFREAARMLGDSGLYDELADQTKHFEDAIFGFIDDPKMAARVQRTGAAVARILRNLTGTLSNVIHGATDALGPGATDDLTENVTRLVESLGELSDRLPSAGLRVADAITESFRWAQGAFGELKGLASEIIEFVNNPGDFIGDESRAKRIHARQRAVADVLNRAAGRQLLSVEGMSENDYQWARIQEGAGAGEIAKFMLRNLTTATGLHKEVGVERLVTAPGVPGDVINQVMSELASMSLERTPGGLYAGRFSNEPRVLARLKETGLLDRLGITAPAGLSSAGAGQSGGGSIDDYEPVPASVRRLNARTGVDNFAVLSQAVGQLLGRVGEREDRETALERTIRMGRSAYDTNLSGDTDNPLYLTGIFGRMRGLHVERLGEYDAAIQAGRSRMREYPSELLRHEIEKLQGGRAKLKDSFDLAAGIMRDNLVGAAREFGLALAQNIEELSPATRAILFDKIGRGTTTLANQTADLLNDAAQMLDRPELAVRNRRLDFGIESLPFSDQQRFVSARNGARIAGAEDLSRFGDVLLGMSPAQIQTAYRGRLSDTEAARRTLVEINAALGEQGDLLERIRQKWMVNPDDEQLIRDLDLATSAYAGLLDKQRQAAEGADLMKRAYIEFAAEARSALENGVGDALYNLYTQTGKVSDAFRDMARSILHSFTQLQGKVLVNALFGDLGVPQQGGGVGGLGGIVGNLFGFGRTGATVTSSSAGGAYVSDLQPGANGLFNAKGNAFLNGRVLPFGLGGVFDQPHYFPMASGRTGVFAEKGPEGIMPLARDHAGRLGVHIAGGESPVVHTNVIVVDDRQAAEAEAARLRAAGDTVRIVEARFSKEAGRASRGQSPFASRRPPR